MLRNVEVSRARHKLADCQGIHGANHGKVNLIRSLPMRRYALRDDQWERIRDLLPGRDRHVGITARNNRLFVEAVL